MKLIMPKEEQTKHWDSIRKTTHGLLDCLQAGYHSVTPYIPPKHIKELDDNAHWGRCTVCHDFFFTKKNSPDEPNPYSKDEIGQIKPLTDL